MASIFGTASTTPSVDAAVPRRSRTSECSLFDDTSAQHRRLEEALRAQKRQRTAATVRSSRSSSYCPQETPSETTLQIRRAQASHPVILEQLTLSAITDTDSIRDSEEATTRLLAEEISATLQTHGLVIVQGVFQAPQLDLSVVPEARQCREAVCRALRKRHISLTSCCQKKKENTASTTPNDGDDGDDDTNVIRFWDVAMRCPGRMDVRYVDGGGEVLDDTAATTTAHAPATSAAQGAKTHHPIWETSPLLQSVVQHALRGAAADDKPRLVYAGWIFSFPGSPDQPWHQDGTPLFPTSYAASGSINQQLPPYALNVFVPLEDADGAPEAGPTEFVVGSHRMDEATAMRAVERHNRNHGKEAATAVVDSDNDDDDDLPPIVSPVLQRGDVLIYDYRTCHRGTANLTAEHLVETNSSSSSSSTTNNSHNSANADNDPNGGGRVRSILYLMYARPWFREHLNFGTERLLPPSSSSSTVTAAVAAVGNAPKPKGQVK